MEMLNDEGTITLMKKHFPVWSEPIPGAEYQQVINDTLTTALEFKAELKQTLDEMSH